MTTGIYIHIPFCAAKCFYCDFLSTAATEHIEAYKNVLVKEIANNLYGVSLVETIYIGGGTPTSIPIDCLLEIIDAVKTYPLSETLEFTVEANPGTISSKTLCALKNAGVNRLSTGLQTTNNPLLKKIGRIHTWENFLESYASARDAGFSNINTDLMYALPDQSVQTLNTDLERVISLKPEHISAYPLTIEQNTPFANLTPADDDTQLEMYEIVKSRLKNAGYTHYEISNFSKQGFESRHNTAYWRRKNYLGFGLGAHSFAGRIRYSNTRDLEKYIAADGNTKKLLVSPEWITRLSAAEEFLFLGLRLREGVSLPEFYKKFGQSVFEFNGNAIDRMASLSLLEVKDGMMFLTDAGINVSNYVFAELVATRN